MATHRENLMTVDRRADHQGLVWDETDLDSAVADAEDGR